MAPLKSLQSCASFKDTGGKYFWKEVSFKEVEKANPLSVKRPWWHDISFNLAVIWRWYWGMTLHLPNLPKSNTKFSLKHVSVTREFCESLCFSKLHKRSKRSRSASQKCLWQEVTLSHVKKHFHVVNNLPRWDLTSNFSNYWPPCWAEVYPCITIQTMMCYISSCYYLLLPVSDSSLNSSHPRQCSSLMLCPVPALTTSAQTLWWVRKSKIRTIIIFS